MYHGDIRLGETHDFKFTTVDGTGVPVTLSGSPVISAYVGNGTTEITAGITLSVDFDSRTGFNNIRVVASGGNGFATTTDVDLVITTGTIGGISAVGYVVASFSIENRSAVMPTVAARTLDVNATGGAGIDWANVDNPTSTVSLTNTTVGIVTLVNSLAAAVIQAIWDKATSALTTVGSIGKLLVDNINVTISSRSTFNSATDGVIVATGGIQATSFAAGAIDAAALAASAGQEIADEVLNRNLAGGGSGNTRNVRNSLRGLRNRVDTGGGVLDVYQEDDSTLAWTGTVTRDAAADPITEINPA